MWSIEQAQQKLIQARELPYGAARTAASEYLVRTLENEGPRQVLPEALLNLVETYIFGQPTPASFAAFSKLLRLYDSNPEFFTEETSRALFWQFKWISGDLTAYPQISRDQARTLLDEMRRRYRLAGLGESAPDRAEYGWALHLGLEDEAEAWKARWLSHGEDEMDCASCRQGGLIHDLVSEGKFQEALDLGAPTEDLCNREPASSHRQLAMACLELGMGREAGLHLRRAQATRDQYDPNDLGLEFEILARGGQLDEAFKLLREQGRQALALTGDPGDNRAFLRFVLAGLAWARESEGQRPTFLGDAKAVLNERLEAQGFGPDEGWSLERLSHFYDWAYEQSLPLARAFDRRAGSDNFSRALQEATSAPRLVDLVLPEGVSLETEGASIPLAEATVEDLPDHASWADWAEAGAAWQELGQLERAFEAYARASELALEAKAPTAFLAELARRWFPVAESQGRAALGQVYPLAMAAMDQAGAELDDRYSERVGLPESFFQQQAYKVLALTMDLAARSFAALEMDEAPGFLRSASEKYVDGGQLDRAGQLLLVLGQVEAERGLYDQALATYREAVGLFEEAVRPRSKARALDAYIDLLRKTGQEHQVQALLEDLL